MIKEFVKYEQALALKELGFDEPCLIKDTEQGEDCALYYVHDNGTPTFSQAFRWFREKHGLYSIIHCPTKKTAVFTITGFDVLSVHSMQKLKTYEEAESACLDKLIEIVKDDKS